MNASRAWLLSPSAPFCCGAGRLSVSSLLTYTDKDKGSLQWPLLTEWSLTSHLGGGDQQWQVAGEGKGIFFVF